MVIRQALSETDGCTSNCVSQGGWQELCCCKREHHGRMHHHAMAWALRYSTWAEGSSTTACTKPAAEHGFLADTGLSACFDRCVMQPAARQAALCLGSRHQAAWAWVHRIFVVANTQCHIPHQPLRCMIGGCVMRRAYACTDAICADDSAHGAPIAGLLTQGAIVSCWRRRQLGGAARSPARSCAVIDSAAADDAVLVAINVTGVVTTALVHQRSVASLQRSSVCTCDASVMAAASHSDALLRNISLTRAMARQQSFCTRAMAPRHTSAQPQ
jgi:hypothetical protein